jgi:hypothetical protein
MAGRGVKHSRWRCDYGCGGRHAHTHAIVCPCPCPPLFVRARTRCRSSTPFPTILAYPFVLVSTGPCLSPLGCTGWPSCLPLLIRVLRRLFVIVSICLSPPICVRSVVLVPTAWSRPFGLRSCLPRVVCARCLSPPPGCTRLTSACSRSCSFSLARARLGSFVLVRLPFALICACPASRLCLYQIYG